MAYVPDEEALWGAKHGEELDSNARVAIGMRQGFRGAMESRGR